MSSHVEIGARGAVALPANVRPRLLSLLSKLFTTEETHMNGIREPSW